MFNHFNDFRMEMFIRFFFLSFGIQFCKGLNNVRKLPATPQHSYLNLFQKKSGIQTWKGFAYAMFTDFMMITSLNFVLWCCPFLHRNILVCSGNLDCPVEFIACLWTMLKKMEGSAILLSLPVRKHLWTIPNTWGEQCVEPIWKMCLFPKKCPSVVEDGNNQSSFDSAQKKKKRICFGIADKASNFKMCFFFFQNHCSNQKTSDMLAIYRGQDPPLSTCLETSG